MAAITALRITAARIVGGVITALRLGASRILAILQTWNPLDKSVEILLLNGNLTFERVTNILGWVSVKSQPKSYVIGTDTAKVYFEIILDVIPTLNGTMVGIGNTSASNDGFCGADVNSWGLQPTNALKWHSGSSSATGLSSLGTPGQRVMVALNTGNGNLWFGAIGSFQAGADPATDTAPHFTVTNGATVLIMGSARISDGAKDTLVASADDFAHAVPSGFVAWGG